MTKLRTKDQLFFAFGSLGQNIIFQAATAWLFFFWAGRGDPNQALLPLGTLGILLGIGRFIEAFDDPLIGHLSDVTSSRWGRRFPYIFFGAPLLALSFFLLWTPPANLSPLLLALYFFFALQFFFFAYTFVSAPSEGILPEIAKTTAQRVSTSAWRVVFGAVGAGIGLIGSSLLIERLGFAAMGAILGLTALAAFWIMILGIRKKVVQSAPAQITLPKALLSTLKNKQFLIFSSSFILFSLGLNLLTALLPFYTTVILGRSEGLVALFSGLIIASVVFTLPFQTFLAGFKGKKWSYAASMLTLGLLFPFLAVVGLLPGDAFWQLILIVAVIGIPLSGQFVFPAAILADVIDYDATQTGQRREAIYYGMQNTLQKFSFALASLTFGIILSAFGSSLEQPLGIRLIGPIAGVFTLIGFLIFALGYRLPDKIGQAG